MESKELRIGNYIRTPRGIEQAIDVLCDGVNTVSYHAITYDEIEPIPLDAELLVKCGFVFADEHRCYLPYGFMPRAGFKIELGKHTDLKHETYWHVYCANYPVDIYYLHQLQNLYFALTGQDLTVTM